jgi:hypothetical protein
MRRYLGIALLLSGCASTGEFRQIDYLVVDNPEKARLELSYRNESDKGMCLLPEHWPNAAGKINQASAYVRLIVGNESFPIEDFNTGYCPQGCATYVAPGEQVSAHIPYNDFHLPDRLTHESKRLEFSPKAFECRRK